MVTVTPISSPPPTRTTRLRGTRTMGRRTRASPYTKLRPVPTEPRASTRQMWMGTATPTFSLRPGGMTRSRGTKTTGPRTRALPRMKSRPVQEGPKRFMPQMWTGTGTPILSPPPTVGTKSCGTRTMGRRTQALPKTKSAPMSTGPRASTRRTWTGMTTSTSSLPPHKTTRLRGTRTTGPRTRALPRTSSIVAPVGREAYMRRM